MPNYKRVAGPTKVTVTNASSTLATLSLTLSIETSRLVFTCPTAGIFWNYGTATTSTCPLLAGTNEESASNAMLKTLQFIVASGTVDMWVEEYGQ